LFMVGAFQVACIGPQCVGFSDPVCHDFLSSQDLCAGVACSTAALPAARQGTPSENVKPMANQHKNLHYVSRTLLQVIFTMHVFCLPSALHKCTASPYCAPDAMLACLVASNRMNNTQSCAAATKSQFTYLRSEHKLLLYTPIA